MGEGPRAGQGRQGAGRAQAGCRAQGAEQGRVARFHFEVFATLGQGQGLRAGPRQGRAGRRAGAQAGCKHRAQGQGTKGKAGLQDSIWRFSRPENPKITVLQLFEERGPPHTSEFRGYGLRSYRLIRRSPVLGV